MGLVNLKLNEALNTLVGDMFALNRMFDRAVSVLDVKFAMKNTVKFLHPNVAHAFPRLADVISEYQSSRNELTVYPQTPIGNEEYSSLSELFFTLSDSVQKVEMNIAKSIELADEVKDKTTCAFLHDFILEFSKYTAQMLILKDKIGMYGDTSFAYTQFDSDFDKFMIV